MNGPFPRLETMKVAVLKAHPDGVRSHSSDSLYLLNKSREKLGLLRPPVTLNARTGHVLDGDLWIEAARMANVEELPVWLVDIDETLEDIAHLALQNHAGEWMWEQVSGMLKVLKEKNEELLRLTGFHEYDIGPLTAAEWKPATPGPMDGTDAAQTSLL